MNDKLIPIFYIYLQKYLCDNAAIDKTMNKKDAVGLLYQYRIPKVLRPIVLKEMEQYGLIETECRLTIRIINLHNQQCLEKVNKLYGKMGFY